MRFAHRGLKRFILHNDQRGIVPGHASKLRSLVDSLKNARSVKDIKNRTLHTICASYLRRPKDCYAVNVSAQWRLVFDFSKKGGVDRVDYVNYH